MLHLSHILIANKEVTSFEELKLLMKEYARQGEMYLRFDVKPPFFDTPDDWEDQLETAFSSRY